ncbi:MAG TPA: hypothetical protein VFS31_19255, partial [Chitinophagaceae bacterium]|nr:hypothetical protein [Chitinophagaceae bacterium]
YAEVLQQMRDQEENWVMQIRDKGFMQEKDLINLMWPGMIQPATSAPLIQKLSNEENAEIVQMKCETPGASIAYHLSTDSPDVWRLYSHVISLPAGSAVYAKAIRIGYKESEEIRYPHHKKQR